MAERVFMIVFGVFCWIAGLMILVIDPKDPGFRFLCLDAGIVGALFIWEGVSPKYSWSVLLDKLTDHTSARTS